MINLNIELIIILVGAFSRKKCLPITVTLVFFHFDTTNFLKLFVWGPKLNVSRVPFNFKTEIIGQEREKKTFMCDIPHIFQKFSTSHIPKMFELRTFSYYISYRRALVINFKFSGKFLRNQKNAFFTWLYHFFVQEPRFFENIGLAYFFGLYGRFRLGLFQGSLHLY